MMIRNGIQTLLQEAGEAGCYALCLIDVAAEYNGAEPDIVKMLLLGIEKGCICYNWNNPNDNDNFYVKSPATWLYYMTGKHWTVEKFSADYTKKYDEYEVLYYERVKAGSTTGHFERVDFKPIVNSLTVQYGQLHSKRIMKPTN